MKHFLFCLISLLLFSCSEPCSCDKQVKNTIDSLKSIYEDLNTVSVAKIPVVQRSDTIEPNTQSDVYVPVIVGTIVVSGETRDVYKGKKGGLYQINKSGNRASLTVKQKSNIKYHER